MNEGRSDSSFRMGKQVCPWGNPVYDYGTDTTSLFPKCRIDRKKRQENIVSFIS